MGNGGSSEVSGLSLEKVQACGKYYFDNEMDFGLNEADATKLLKEGAGLDDAAAAAVYAKFSDATNPDALFSCLDFLGAAAATCQGEDDAKKSALFVLFDFSKEGKPVARPDAMLFYIFLRSTPRARANSHTRAFFV